MVASKCTSDGGTNVCEPIHLDPYRGDPLLQLLHVELLHLFGAPPLGLLLGGRGRAALAGVLRHGVLLNLVWGRIGSNDTINVGHPRQAGVNPALPDRESVVASGIPPWSVA